MVLRNPEEVADKRNTLDLESLSSKTLYQLRKIAAEIQLGGVMIEGHDLPQPYRFAHKGELIDAIRAICAPGVEFEDEFEPTIKERKRKETNPYTLSVCKHLFPLFEELAKQEKLSLRRNGDKKNFVGWRQLAAEVAQKLKTQFPDPRTDDDEREYVTAYNQIGMIAHELNRMTTEMDDPTYARRVKTIITNFKSALHEHFYVYRLNYNRRYRDESTKRTETVNRIWFDLTECFELAELTFKRVHLQDRSLDWRDVSCAVALVTGRRMSEIHASGKFEYVDDEHVMFKGQLKSKKTKRNAGIAGQDPTIPYLIPVLANSRDVIAAVEWLGAHGRRLAANADVAIVNKKWSSSLGQQLQKYWRFTEQDESQTYHNFRAAYACCICANAEVLPQDGGLELIMKTLGDDVQAASIYRRFELKEGSKTRI